MKATVIKTTGARYTSEFPGWIVDDTDSLFGIDQREEADLAAIPPLPAIWAITHLPSGFRVVCGDFTRATTRRRAANIAQGFYREAKARGWDLFSTVPDRVTEKYKLMSKEERSAFWLAVAKEPIIPFEDEELEEAE